VSTRHRYGGPDLLGLCIDCGRPPADPDHDTPPPTVPAARMNATGSPTGRVRRDAPETSQNAALTARAPSARVILLRALHEAGRSGLTSLDLAPLLPARRDGAPQPPNIAGARLGELWEAGEATIVREWGVCILGACHPHAKPAVVHRPSMSCPVHGRPVIRDGAAVWVSTRHTPTS